MAEREVKLREKNHYELRYSKWRGFYFQYIHFLGYKIVLEIHIPKKVSPLQNAPLGLDHVR